GAYFPRDVVPGTPLDGLPGARQGSYAARSVAAQLPQEALDKLIDLIGLVRVDNVDAVDVLDPSVLQQVIPAPVGCTFRRVARAVYFDDTCPTPVANEKVHLQHGSGPCDLHGRTWIQGDRPADPLE